MTSTPLNSPTVTQTLTNSPTLTSSVTQTVTFTITATATITPTITPTPAYQLILVVPNEYFTPGTPPGYAGAVLPATAGYPVSITIRAVNMSTFQMLPVNDVLTMSSSALADQIRDLSAQVNLINGEANVTVRFMDPGTTYLISAAPQTNTFIQAGSTRPIPCNAGTYSQNPFALMNHASLAPLTAVQGERQLAMLLLNITNPNAAGSAAYEVRGLTITVQDRNGQGIPAQDILASLAIWDNAANTALTQVNAWPSQERVYVPFTAFQVLVYPGETRVLRVVVDLNPVGTRPELRLGAIAAGDVDCAFLDGTSILVRAAAPDAFPMRSDTVAIRSRGLKDSYINYPNPFAAGRQVTQLEYFLEQDSTVTLKIYSIVGEPVRTLADAETQPGAQGLQRYVWDGRNGKGNVVLNGVYFAVLTVKPVSGGAAQTVVLKLAVVK
jgi:hypothetical protein